MRKLFAILAQSVALIGKFGLELVKLPFNIFDWAASKIFGSSDGRFNPMRWNERRERADDVAREHMEALKRSQEPQKTTSIGQTVHDFAMSAPEARPAVSLSTLPEHVRDWLLDLSDADLARLAVAGPEACEKAAAGRPCGIDVPLAPTFRKAAAGIRASYGPEPIVETVTAAETTPPRPEGRGWLSDRVRDRLRAERGFTADVA